MAVTALLASSLNPHLLRRPPQPHPSFARARCFASFNAPSPGGAVNISFAGTILRSPLATAPYSRFMSCISISSAAPSGSGGGGGSDGLGAGGGGGGGGDGVPSGGETDAKSLAGELDEFSALESDVIVLNVGGMSCGGCAASVKRILESQPQVASATVTFETETAVICVAPEVKTAKYWQQQLGEKLASHLTTCGFQSRIKGLGNEAKEIQ